MYKLDASSANKDAINNMPTPKKNLAELRLSGTYQQNKRRYEHLTKPVPTILIPIGRPPMHLRPAEKAAWIELVRTAHPGLLSRSDRIIVEIAARLIVRMRHPDAKNSEYTALLTVLSKLGMTPASRLKLNLPPIAVPTPEVQSEEDRQWAELDELD
jgi:phage terminase small subunit